MLGMTFRTDLALFRFTKPWNSLKENILPNLSAFDGGIRAIKEAMVEEIQRTRGFVNREISGGVRKFAQADGQGGRSYFTDIFLYDEVSGGAGLTLEVVQHLEELPGIFAQIERRLSGVECIEPSGCDMACINCLLDFRNIQEHDRLDRKNGLRLIRYIRHGVLPTLESGEQDNAMRPTLEAERMRARLEIDTGLEVTIREENGHQYFEIRQGTVSLNLRPLSEMLKPEYDPVLRDKHPRQRIELQLEQPRPLRKEECITSTLHDLNPCVPRWLRCSKTCCCLLRCKICEDLMVGPSTLSTAMGCPRRFRTLIEHLHQHHDPPGQDRRGGNDDHQREGMLLESILQFIALVMTFLMNVIYRQ